ncbi:MAG: hypothetical protein ACJAVA_000178 [Flavobacteriaceae bacterium]|jgi:hypothetical protein
MAKIIRQSDNLTKEGLIEYIKFSKENVGKNVYMKPEVGYYCILGRNILNLNWMTSEIIEVISDTEFKTVNSHYKIEN